MSVVGDVALDSSSEIIWGGDTSLYRLSAGVLQTESFLFVERGSAATEAFGVGVAADTYARMYIAADGTLNWGSGAAPEDTNLYRSSANVLRTDGIFESADIIEANIGSASNVTIGWDCSANAAGICFGSGGDTSLSRAGANQLQLGQDGDLIAWNAAGDLLYFGADSDSAFIYGVTDTPGDWLFAGTVDGDSSERIIIRSDGEINWGGGSGSPDTNLYRGAANRLTTNDTFQAAAYRVGSTDGASVTCSGGQFLQNQVVNGGIVTGGSCAAAGGSSSLQAAYDGGNTILTTNARDIDITLANTTTDANFIIDIASGSTSEFQIEANGTDVLQIGSAGQLQLDVQGTNGGILIGGDVQLYRSGTNTLSTASGDAFTVNGTLTVAGSGNLIVNSSGNVQVQGSNVNVTRASSGQNAYLGWVTGDANPRFQINADGTLNWGPGNAALDTNLYRSAANTLRTDDSFIVQPASNNTSAFLVQNNGGTNNVLQVDTTNSRVAIGIGTTAPAQRLTVNAGANYGWNDYIGLTDGTRTGYIGLANSAGTLGFRTGETGDTAHDYVFFGQDGNTQIMTLDGEGGLDVNAETSELLTLNNTFSGATSAWIQFQYEGVETWELYNNTDQFIIYEDTTNVNRLSVGASGAYIVVDTDLDNGLDEGLTIENTDNLQLMDLQVENYGDPNGLTTSLEIGEGFASSEIVLTAGTPEWSVWVTDDEALGSDSMYFWNIDRASWTFAMNGDGNASFWSGASTNAFTVLGSNGTDILFNVNSSQGGVVIGASADTNPSNPTARGQLRLWGTGTNGAGGRIWFGDGNDSTNSNVWIGEQGSGDSDILILSGESIVLDSTNGGGNVSTDGNFDVNGSITLDFLGGGSSTTNGVCHSGSDIDGTNSGSNRTLLPCNNSAGDIAEWYEVRGKAEAGDLLAVTDEPFTHQSSVVDAFTGLVKDQKQSKTINKLELSHSAYQDTIIGIVSSSPSRTYGKDVEEQAKNPQPIALKGRVPVKATTDNGPIKAGDKLVASHKPGKAMKATEPGYVIGTAISDLKQGDGMVEVFVETGWYGGEKNNTNNEPGKTRASTDYKSYSNGEVVLVVITVMAGFHLVTLLTKKLAKKIRHNRLNLLN